MTDSNPTTTSTLAGGQSHSGEAISGVFRGEGDAIYSLKDPNSGKGTASSSLPAFIAGGELADLADGDDRIVVLTADLSGANRLLDFAKRHPARFFNVGVAEQNMLSIAAGLASAGLIPFAGTFAAYAALLACEQIRTDIAYTGMPVRILAHHSGMSLGFYGSSHHALEDLGIMRTLADLTVICAADSNELRAILRASTSHPGPMYIRLGRGRDPDVYDQVPHGFRIGKAIRIREGSDLTIITTGSEVRPCLDAADALETRGMSVRVVDMHTIHPLDKEEILAAARDTGAVLTVEEHNVNRRTRISCRRDVDGGRRGCTFPSAWSSRRICDLGSSSGTLRALPSRCGRSGRRGS